MANEQPNIKKEPIINDMNIEKEPTADNTGVDYRKKLETEFDQVQSRNRTLNSKKIMFGNELKETKIRIMQELFGLMEQAGYNPNDMNSINEFLQTLEQKDPDLKELFEKAFNGLMEEENEMVTENVATPPIESAPDATIPPIENAPDATIPPINNTNNV